MSALWAIRIEVPLGSPLPSGANLREHWAVKAQRTKAHRASAKAALMTHGKHWLAHWVTMRGNERLRVAVRLTRVATRKLDDDNLAYAFKAWRDGIADCLGIDDGSARLTWEYHQRKGLAGVEMWLEVQSPESIVAAGNGPPRDEVTSDGVGVGSSTKTRKAGL